MWFGSKHNLEVVHFFWLDNWGKSTEGHVKREKESEGG